MKFETTYEVDVAMQDALIRQGFYTLFLKPKLLIIITIVGLIIISFFYADKEIQKLCYALFIVATIMFISFYFKWREIGRKRLSLSIKSTTRIEISDEEIHSITDKEANHYSWERFDGLVETRDFMMLMSGGICILTIPKKYFPSDVQKFISEMCHSKKI